MNDWNDLTKCNRRFNNFYLLPFFNSRKFLYLLKALLIWFYHLPSNFPTFDISHSEPLQQNVKSIKCENEFYVFLGEKNEVELNQGCMIACRKTQSVFFAYILFNCGYDFRVLGFETPAISSFLHHALKTLEKSLLYLWSSMSG